MNLNLLGLKVVERDLSMEPSTTVSVKEDSKKQRVLRFVEALDDHDDVQKVFANFDLVE